MELQMQIELATQMLIDILSHVDDDDLHTDGVEMVSFLYDIASKDISKNCHGCRYVQNCFIIDSLNARMDTSGFSCNRYEPKEPND